MDNARTMVSKWCVAAPVLASGVLLAVTAGALAAYAALRPGAPFTYALDDAYIHMAIADHLATRGVWGVAELGGFTGSSSSLLWTLLLALARLLIPRPAFDLVPLIFNMLFALGCVVLAWRVVAARWGTCAWVTWAAPLAVVLLTPLTPLVLSGMETTLQIFLVLGFAGALPAAWAAAPPTRRQTAALLLWAVLLGAVRYESAALLLAGAGLLGVLRGRWRLAAAVVGVGAAPMLLYGLISTVNGWWFLPNSVWIKSLGTANHWRDPLGTLIDRAPQLWHQLHLRGLWVGLLLAGLWALLSRAQRVRADVGLALLGLSTLTAQVLFGQLGWFYRYEAYTVALGVVVLLVWLGGARTAAARVMPLLLAAAAVGLLSGRAVDAHNDMPGAMTNIYDQQIHMARFVAQYYPGECVILNDIGAVSYWGQGCIIDMAALATREIAQARLQNQSITPTVMALAEKSGARLALIYTEWFPNEVPPQWTRVGGWTLDRQVVAGWHTVSFYAVHPQDAALMRLHLDAFEAAADR